MEYNKFLEYKDSCVEWLGQVPGHWKIASIGRLFDIKAGGDLKEEFFSKDKTEQHCYPIYTNTVVSKQVYGFTSNPFFKRNTITVTGRGDVGYAIYRDHAYDAIIRLIVLSPRDKKNCKFFMYYLNSVLDFKVENTAINQLSTMQISPYRLTYPTFEEQVIIVNFLDHETAKIDTLIEKQKQLIKLLKEKRQAVISHAVTKGLNPDVAMKDSGVEWLGEVPEHWEVKRISLLFSDSKTRASSVIELTFPILSVSIHHGISDKEISENESDRKLQRSEDKSLYKIVHNNYLAYNMMRAWQGGFGASKLSGLVSPAYVVCKPKSTINTSYFELVLRTSNSITELKKYSRGITDFRLRLYWDEFKNIRVPIPPSDEIDKILEYINKTNSNYGKLILVAEYQIKLLQERRTALISAAVTGKIDVRDWKKPGGFS